MRLKFWFLKSIKLMIFLSIAGKASFNCGFCPVCNGRCSHFYGDFRLFVLIQNDGYGVWTDVVPHVFAIEIDDSRRMAYDLLCQLQRTNWVHEPPPTLRQNDPLHARFSAPCVNYWYLRNECFRTVLNSPKCPIDIHSTQIDNFRPEFLIFREITTFQVICEVRNKISVSNFFILRHTKVCV